MGWHPCAAEERRRETEEGSHAVAGAAYHRFGAQRRVLPRREFQDLSTDPYCAKDFRGCTIRCRYARFEPAYLRVWEEDLSVQGLRVDRDAALPLAVQLLSESLTGSDGRLDGRDLRTLDRGARRRHSHARLLVSGPQHAEADDRSTGVRRRRQ